MSLNTTQAASLRAQDAMLETPFRLKKSLSRLSSGFRINEAADDAAALAISESVRARVRGLDFSSPESAAEGELSQIRSLVIRMQTLAVHSGREDLSQADRGKLDREYQRLKQQIDRLVEVHDLGAPNGLEQSASSVGDRASAGAAVETLAEVLERVAVAQAKLSAANTSLQVTTARQQTARMNVDAASSTPRDVDAAEDASRLARTQVLLHPTAALDGQANQSSQLALSLI